MHSNLGGGYPDDGMSYVSLRWMLNEARKQGLCFKPSALAEIDLAAAPYGRMYDSRAGVGSYYRYDPRRLDNPPTDNQRAVIPSPKIHETVIWRMAAGIEAYAPLSLPKTLRIVSDPGHESDEELNTHIASPNIHTFQNYHKALKAQMGALNTSAETRAKRRQQAGDNVTQLNEPASTVVNQIRERTEQRRQQAAAEVTKLEEAQSTVLELI
jgi:hypothetical protein